MSKQDDKQERMIPKLRFPEFQTASGWLSSTIDDSCKSFSGEIHNTQNKLLSYFEKCSFLKIANPLISRKPIFSK